MRMIKFRANDSNGNWYYGSLIRYKSGEAAIANFERYGYECSDMARIKVDPKTVGLFTGLVDKNGNEIYEGDIITYYVSLKKVDGEFVEDARKTVVEWDGVGFNIASLSKITHTIEVIGNVHDNPELMNG